MENRIEEMEGGQDETDPVYAEYFQYVMEKNDLSSPTTILEAGTLFEKLTKFAMGKDRSIFSLFYSGYH